MFILDTFVKGIAAHLPGWTFRTPKADDTQYWRNLDGPGGAILSFYHNTSGKKVEVSPIFIRRGGSQYPSNYKSDPPLVSSINVGEARTPEAAAKDIKRRIIEAGYLTQYEQGKEQLARLDAYEAAKAAVAAEFADLLNDDTHRQGSDSVSRYVYKPGQEGGSGLKDTCHVEIRVNSDDVELKISSCPVEVAKQILALFPKLPKGQRTA